MPSYSFRVGVAGVVVFESAALPIDPLTGVDFTASVVTSPTKLFLNDIQTGLPISDSLEVCVTPVGEDKTNTGLTVGPATDESGDLEVTAAGQVIKVVIENADFPTNFGKGLAAIWLKEGAGDYKLARFSYVDPAKDFITHVMTRPLATVQEFAYSLLASSTADDDLGDRNPEGWNRVRYGPTTGGVDVERIVDEVTIDIDTSTGFPIATARSTTVSFRVAANDILDIVRAGAGNFVRNTHAGVEYEEALQSLATANARVTGVKPFMLIMPINSRGFQEIRLFIGSLTTNQVGFTQNWGKTGLANTSYVFRTAIQDRLLPDQHCEIVFLRRAA
jgi:hypothetical protein